MTGEKKKNNDNFPYQLHRIPSQPSTNSLRVVNAGSPQQPANMRPNGFSSALPRPEGRQHDDMVQGSILVSDRCGGFMYLSSKVVDVFSNMS